MHQKKNPRAKKMKVEAMWITRRAMMILAPAFGSGNFAFWYFGGGSFTGTNISKKTNG